MRKRQLTRSTRLSVDARNSTAPAGLDADVVWHGLAAIDRASGRDYALISVAVVTGRRVSELDSSCHGDLEATESGYGRVLSRRIKGDEAQLDCCRPRSARLCSITSIMSITTSYEMNILLYKMFCG
jgi:hypothetical protein